MLILNSDNMSCFWGEETKYAKLPSETTALYFGLMPILNLNIEDSDPLLKIQLSKKLERLERILRLCPDACYDENLEY
jgi:hypothetical protein